MSVIGYLLYGTLQRKLEKVQSSFSELIATKVAALLGEKLNVSDTQSVTRNTAPTVLKPSFTESAPSGPLTEAQEAIILPALSQYPGHKVLILVGVGNETADYANQFSYLFRKAKWTVEGPRPAPTDQVVLDLQISMDPFIDTHPEVGPIISSFVSAGIPHRPGGVHDPNIPSDWIVLWVGASEGGPTFLPLQVPPGTFEEKATSSTTVHDDLTRQSIEDKNRPRVQIEGEPQNMKLLVTGSGSARFVSLEFDLAVRSLIATATLAGPMPPFILSDLVKAEPRFWEHDIGFQLCERAEQLPGGKPREWRFPREVVQDTTQTLHIVAGLQKAGNAEPPFSDRKLYNYLSGCIAYSGSLGGPYFTEVIYRLAYAQEREPNGEYHQLAEFQRVWPQPPGSVTRLAPPVAQ